MTSLVRTPAVAGRFYPGHREELLRDIREYTAPTDAARSTAIGCIVPHAGYVYSGHVAGAVFSRIEIPEHCIVLCPNHTGFGVRLAIMAADRVENSVGRSRGQHRVSARSCCSSFPLLRKTAPRTAPNTRLRCNCHSCKPAEEPACCAHCRRHQRF